MQGVRDHWVVLKFGGTSVSKAGRWETIASCLRERLDAGLRPMVVCSALSGVSNALERVLQRAPEGAHGPILDEIVAQHRALGEDLGVDADALLSEQVDALRRLALGASLTGEASPRLHARVMAAGELMSTTLGAAYLRAQGLSVAWRDARDMLEARRGARANPSRHYLSADCAYEPDPALAEDLAEVREQIILTQGFIARDARGATVLLGRGGSDTSAAYLAARLQAARLEIWTDVPGMFTANPRAIPSARLLEHLAYDEAQELATMGGKVLHPRCIDPVRRYDIPLHIRHTEEPDQSGTVISAEAPAKGAQVKAISAKGDITLISMDTLGMWQQVGFLADAFAVFKREGLSVDLVATSESNVTVSLDAMANALEPETIDRLLEGLNRFCAARAITGCAAVSLVGRRIRSILDELGPALEVFEEQQIYMVSQAASDLNLTFVVDEDQAARLVRKLHAQLFSRRLPDHLFGPTWRELLGEHDAPAVAEAPWWRGERERLLKLAEDGPVFAYSEQRLEEAVAAVGQLEALDQTFYAMKANPNAAILAQFEAAGMGFECVSPGEVERVLTIFPEIDRRRILFTPNFAPIEEYAFGFDHGLHVTLDNLGPLARWPGVFEGQDLIIRMDPGRGRGHHKYVRTAGPQSKFGVAPGEVARLAELVEQAGARVVGLHSHVGSGIEHVDTWSDIAVFLASLADYFPHLRVLNLGGGLGVPQRVGQPAVDMGAVAEQLARFKQAHPQYALWMEPGRFMVAEAGVLLARVTQTKDKGDIAYIGLEAGMNSLIRPALYGAYHEIVNLTRLDAPRALTAEIVGPICESGDVLGHARRVPTSEPGDVFLIANAGAYGRAMSSRYNLREPATEAYLRGPSTQ